MKRRREQDHRSHRNKRRRGKEKEESPLDAESSPSPRRAHWKHAQNKRGGNGAATRVQRGGRGKSSRRGWRGTVRSHGVREVALQAPPMQCNERHTSESTGMRAGENGANDKGDAAAALPPLPGFYVRDGRYFRVEKRNVVDCVPAARKAPGSALPLRARPSESSSDSVSDALRASINLHSIISKSELEGMGSTGREIPSCMMSALLQSRAAKYSSDEVSPNLICFASATGNGYEPAALSIRDADKLQSIQRTFKAAPMNITHEYLPSAPSCIRWTDSEDSVACVLKRATRICYPGGPGSDSTVCMYHNGGVGPWAQRDEDMDFRGTAWGCDWLWDGTLVVGTSRGVLRWERGGQWFYKSGKRDVLSVCCTGPSGCFGGMRNGAIMHVDMRRRGANCVARAPSAVCDLQHLGDGFSVMGTDIVGNVMVWDSRNWKTLQKMFVDNTSAVQLCPTRFDNDSFVLVPSLTRGECRATIFEIASGQRVAEREVPFECNRFNFTIPVSARRNTDIRRDEDSLNAGRVLMWGVVGGAVQHIPLIDREVEAEQ